MKFSEYFTEARTTSKKKDVTKFKLPRRNLKKRKELKERMERSIRELQDLLGVVQAAKEVTTLLRKH